MHREHATGRTGQVPRAGWLTRSDVRRRARTPLDVAAVNLIAAGGSADDQSWPHAVGIHTRELQRERAFSEAAKCSLRRGDEE